MKLEREDGYWSLHRSGIREWIAGSSWLKRNLKGLQIIFVFIWLILCGYWLYCLFPGIYAGWTGLLILLCVWVGSGIVINALVYYAVYGCIRGRPKRECDLPRAEFHTLGTCQHYGKRILNMVKELNVGDHYIFLLNFHHLFYHDEHRLENPTQGVLNAIGRAVRVLPERQKTSTWTRNPFQAIAGGWEAGKEAGEKVIVEGVAKKLGGLPEPPETVAIITKEYLPQLMREFPRDVAMYIAVIVCSAQNYTAIFPFDSRAVTKEEAVRVASNPTRENVVNYCSKFSGLAVEEPVVRRKGLME